MPVAIPILILFQATPSVWRETYSRKYARGNAHISIHSLRLEGDKSTHGNLVDAMYFNPLPPYGGRHLFDLVHNIVKYFNPLPPYGGRPVRNDLDGVEWKYFNPLPPYGGRQSMSDLE